MSAGECLNVFARRTVFVVGAGASAEFGLPLGSAVASEIRSKLYFGRDETGRLSRHHGDPELWRVVQNHAGRAQIRTPTSPPATKSGLAFTSPTRLTGS